MHNRFPTMPLTSWARRSASRTCALAPEKMPTGVRASGDGAGDDQHGTTPRRHGWNRNLGQRRHQPRLARAVADRQHRARVRTQITELGPFLSDNWRALMSRTSGNPVYEKPVVLVIYREDHKFLLDQVRPRRRPHRGRIRSGHRLATHPARVHRWSSRRVALVRTAGARARARRAADRDALARRRSGPGDHRAHLAGRRSVHHRSPRLAARDQGRTRQRRRRDLNFSAYAEARSLFRLRHAHAAERDQRNDRHLDAVRRVERRGRRRADRGPAPVRGDQHAPIWTRPRRCCASMADCGSGTSSTSSRASGIPG